MMNYHLICIDTCRIYKSNIVRLFEAIDNMYAWYRDAAWPSATLSLVGASHILDIAGHTHEVQENTWLTPECRLLLHDDLYSECLLQ